MALRLVVSLLFTKAALTAARRSKSDSSSRNFELDASEDFPCLKGSGFEIGDHVSIYKPAAKIHGKEGVIKGCGKAAKLLIAERICIESPEGKQAGCFLLDNLLPVKKQIEPVMCCQAMIADCLSCSVQQTIQEYCAENPETQGCPDDEPEENTGTVNDDESDPSEEELERIENEMLFGTGDEIDEDDSEIDEDDIESTSSEKAETQMENTDIVNDDESDPSEEELERIENEMLFGTGDDIDEDVETIASSEAAEDFEVEDVETTASSETADEDVETIASSEAAEDSEVEDVETTPSSEVLQEATPVDAPEDRNFVKVAVEGSGSGSGGSESTITTTTTSSSFAARHASAVMSLLIASYVALSQ